MSESKLAKVNEWTEKMSLELMKVIAEINGGECLSEKKPPRWRCKNGHEWSCVLFYSLEFWCPMCAGEQEHGCG
jgi:Zn finger protein HypA/HybF involved in hydrogenase expression